MKEGSIVFNNELGRGIVEKISPSGSLVRVRFKHFTTQVVLRSSIRLIQ